MQSIARPTPILAALSILLSVAFLIMGNGLQLMLLPIRGGIEGFSSLQIGLLGSGYFFGFVLGCAFSPRMIMRVGHIRTFAALVAIASAAALGYPMAVDALVWVPIVMTRSSQPPPITIVRFRPLRMFRLSPTGTVAIFLIGLATGSFWSLAPSYASTVSGSVSDAAWFMSAAVLGGAVAQLPAGKISDRIDRRQVIIGLAACCIVVGIVLVLRSGNHFLWLGLGAAFGAGLLPSYAIAAAHVFDFADRSDYVEISAGLLLLNGMGSTIGPLLSSASIEIWGQPGFFVANTAIHIVLIGYVGLRLSRREGLPTEEKQTFDLIPAFKRTFPP